MPLVYPSHSGSQSDTRQRQSAREQAVWISACTRWAVRPDQAHTRQRECRGGAQCHGSAAHNALAETTLLGWFHSSQPEYLILIPTSTAIRCSVWPLRRQKNARAAVHQLLDDRVQLGGGGGISDTSKQVVTLVTLRALVILATSAFLATTAFLGLPAAAGRQITDAKHLGVYQHLAAQRALAILQACTQTSVQEARYRLADCLAGCLPALHGCLSSKNRVKQAVLRICLHLQQSGPPALMERSTVHLNLATKCNLGKPAAARTPVDDRQRVMHSRQNGPCEQRVTTASSAASMHTGHSLATPMASLPSSSFFLACVNSWPAVQFIAGSMDWQKYLLHSPKGIIRPAG